MAHQDESREDEQFEDALSSMDDNETSKRILEGKKELYALLVRKFNQRLYRVGLFIINRESEVEDVMQTTYINAYEKLGRSRFQ